MLRSRGSIFRGAIYGVLRRPPLAGVGRMNTTILTQGKPPKARWRVLSLAAMVAFLQGSSFATFSMMVGTSLALFPALSPATRIPAFLGGAPATENARPRRRMKATQEKLSG